MGATSLNGIMQRAMKGQAQSYGPPIAGKSLNLSFDASDKTLALEGGATYRLVVTTACFIGLANTTQAANQEYLQPNWDRLLSVPVGGLTLHATQVSATGILYAAKLDDVE